MAYNETIRLRAYTLYLQGFNFEQIARALKSDFRLKTMKSATIKKWAYEKDENGLTWEDHRLRVKKALIKTVNEAYRTRYAELRVKAETIQEALYKQLTSEKIKIKSFEGAVYAFKGISEFVLALSEAEHSKQHPVVIIQTMLEVFKEIPAVRKAIADNWGRIVHEIRERLQSDTIAIEYTNGEGKE